MIWTLCAVLAAPGLAVAHGTAHQELAAEEHHDDDHHAVEHHADDQDHGHPAIRGEDHPAEHEHAEISARVSAGRLDLPVFVTAPADDFSVPVIKTVVGLSVDPSAPGPSGPPPDSPRQPRAPPLD